MTFELYEVGSTFDSIPKADEIREHNSESESQHEMRRGKVR